VCTDGVLTTAYKRVDAVGEYIKANFEIAVSGQVDQRAKLVAELAARDDAATTAATYLNWGADGAAGGRMYLVVTSITWDTQTALTVTLQDCNTSGGAYSDHTAFTAIAAPATGGSEMKVLDHAAINQYVAITVAFTGGAGGHCTAAVAVVFD
jgi:transglutaminase-like putative cysteine protease